MTKYPGNAGYVLDMPVSEASELFRATLEREREETLIRAYERSAIISAVSKMLGSDAQEQTYEEFKNRVAHRSEKVRHTYEDAEDISEKAYKAMR